ncbi:MAG: P pilus assembly protein, chaperone PapD [Coleofasciculus sp. Co-bin14]|nr:P pilus assembly protein, chaperone PapD [Coleofasciculus sp. Co-bin14]MBD0385969.1 P pilus assembly protein, chaperone PapD [Nostoc sp. C3-bin3]
MVCTTSLCKSALILTSWTLSAALFWADKSVAQVSISPLVIEVEARRGQAQGVINVGNNTNELFRARVYAEPFTYSRDRGFQSLLKGEQSDLTPYLQFSPRELNVPPGVERRIRFIVRLPPNVPPGEYRAVVFTENLKEILNESGNSVGLATRIGVTIYVRQGNLAPSLVVENASWNSQQRQIQMLVSNTGGASVRPSVNWTLKQGETVVKTGKLDPTGIVAKSERNFLLGYPNKDLSGITPGDYQLSGELIWSEGDNQRSKGFSVNLTIPAAATVGQ